MSKNNLNYVKKDLPGKVGTYGALLLFAGLILGVFAFFTNFDRALFSYLNVFMFLVTIGAGSLWLVALEYLVGADWSTPFRRISEFLSSVLPICLILSIPLLFGMHDIFHWTHGEVVAEDEILKGKSPYLNTSFFIIRVIAVFLIWTIFWLILTRNSRKQDETRDQALTKRNVVLSGVFMPLFAITITIAGVDWMMSLEPHWFSTMFGVYTFSGAAYAAIACLTLITVLLHEKGYLHPRVNKDHYYSLGTLLFAFTCFWGYIAFSQYMLIWYADLPEESFWFLHRWEGGWKYVSLVLIIAHFVVPFLGLLAYKQKTNAARLKFMSIWVLAAHYLDLYWVIMPNMYNTEAGYSFSWMDIAFPIFGVGLLIFLFNMRAKKTNLVPVGDPKLERGLNFRL